MHIMHSKKFIVVALAAAGVVALGACGSNSGNTGAPTGPAGTTAGSTGANTSNAGPGGAPVSIQYYGGWTGADLAKMQGLVDKYNAAQSGVHVDLTSLQWTQMFTKFLADYQAGSSPDVVAMHTFEVGQFANMGVLDTDAIKSMNLQQSDFLPIAWDGSIVNGAQYGVPLDVNMHAVYYNKDMFAAAGITGFPTTRDDFVADAIKLTVDANGNHPDSAKFDPNNVKTYGLGFLMNHHAFYQMYALLNQEGYNPFTADMTSISLDAAQFKGPVEFLQELIFKDKVVPVGEKSPIDDFKAGTVAMAIDGNWQLSGMTDIPFQWDTAEYPQIFGQKAVWGASEILTFPKTGDASRQAAAEMFVQWLSDNSTDWAASGQIVANQKAFSAATRIPGIDAYINELNYVKFLPANPKSTTIFSSAAPSPILTFAQDVVLNDKNYQEVTTQFEQDINNALK
ncbi:MAG: extracellular solute-binding protein [Micrococcales bacterium]|nr:extracellular solute-binding protein [Micrococcales bacterium]